MTDRIAFDHVAFFGRNFDEYLQLFALEAKDLEGRRILDCPSGPCSFVADSHERGLDATGVDPMYAKSVDELSIDGTRDIENGLKQILGAPTIHPIPDFDAYAQRKREALRKFLADYSAHRSRYIEGRLPNLPFANRSFDLVLSAHLLFSYSPTDEDGVLDSRVFDRDWHHEAMRELSRVAAREIRLYPTIANVPEPRRHRYAEGIAADLCANGWKVEFVASRYDQFAAKYNDCLVATRLVYFGRETSRRGTARRFSLRSGEAPLA